MRLLTCLGLTFIVSIHYVFAQTVPSSSPPPSSTSSLPPPPSSRLNGKIADTSETRPLSNASVLLLSKADSILIKYTRTDKSGSFSMANIPAGQYVLLISYPEYADYVDELTLKDSAAKTLPSIGLTRKSKLLETVVVKGSKGAIQLKGDTIEFNADSFKTRAGATVEELLKKLPGFQVDRDGTIKAQGKNVEKVLVDGEEFFGDDPTLVTQNLHADMVDKVQLYDKKSDQASFSGIDDGQRSKTINLKLKEDKKNGYFGRLSAAAGTDGYYDAQAMMNKFNGKQKMAGYGILSNTGKTGLNWQERDNYGQSLAALVDVDETTGNMVFSGSSTSFDNWSGQYSGQGLPSVQTAGAHYNNKWHDDKLSFNTNYKFMDLRVKDSSNSQSEYIVPDSFYFNNGHQSSRNEVTRHSFDLNYEIKFDTTSTLKVMADGGIDHKNSLTHNYSELLARDSSLVNQNDQSRTTTSDYKVVNSNLLWKKKLGKPGRTISINFRENYNTTNSFGYLYSDASFYTGGTFSHDSVTDQYKTAHNNNLLLDGKIVFTQPLFSHGFLGISYGIDVNNSRSDLEAYNKAGGGKYSLLDSLYSNNYEFNTILHSGGLSYSYIRSKLRLTIGSAAGVAHYIQKDMIADTTMDRRYLNWYPQANLSYNFSANRRLNFGYNGSSQPPSLYQIQPARTNENALNITIGNPDLKPAFNHRFNLYYNDYKVLTERSIWFSMYGGYTANAIASSTTLSLSTGKSIIQYVNISGNYNAGASIDYGFKWAKPKMRVSFNGSTSQSAYSSILNNVRNTTNSGSYTLGFGLSKYIDNKLDVSIGPSATYTDSRSSVNTTAATHYWTGTINSQVRLFFPHRFDLAVSDETTLRQKTAVFTGNNNVNIVNASIIKKFLKNDALQFMLTANDLLKQNIGFNRTVSSNFISQNTNTTIQRYFMFTVTWNFSKMGGSN